MIAEVIINTNAKSLNKPLDYIIPKSMEKEIRSWQQSNRTISKKKRRSLCDRNKGNFRICKQRNNKNRR